MLYNPNDLSREHGRFQLSTAKSGKTVIYIENVNRDEDHWLTLEGFRGEAVGFLHLKRIAPHLFAASELRPATGPLSLPERTDCVSVPVLDAEAGA